MDAKELAKAIRVIGGINCNRAAALLESQAAELAEARGLLSGAQNTAAEASDAAKTTMGAYKNYPGTSTYRHAKNDHEQAEAWLAGYKGFLAKGGR
ncbi:MAG: hypothetical protein Q8O14_14705 [bacterium]|nr:hypothetical protein [bacterium]